jgi:hypothetical protein
VCPPPKRADSTPGAPSSASSPESSATVSFRSRRRRSALARVLEGHARHPAPSPGVRQGHEVNASPSRADRFHALLGFVVAISSRQRQSTTPTRNRRATNQIVS